MEISRAVLQRASEVGTDLRTVRLRLATSIRLYPPLETSKLHVQYALAPQSHRHRTGAQYSGYLLVVLAVCGKQSDASPSDPLLGRSRRLDEALKY
jgi:hypothetical protein